VLEYAREGDVIVVHTLDRLGRTVRDTLNMIHELSERGIGVRNLADPIRVDSSRPADPMAQLAVVLLALFAQMASPNIRSLPILRWAAGRYRPP
jgi:DNA invertase Pin-like site-specific DNA recombinase